MTEKSNVRKRATVGKHYVVLECSVDNGIYDKIALATRKDGKFAILAYAMNDPYDDDPEVIAVIDELDAITINEWLTKRISDGKNRRVR